MAGLLNPKNRRNFILDFLMAIFLVIIPSPKNVGFSFFFFFFLVASFLVVILVHVIGLLFGHVFYFIALFVFLETVFWGRNKSSSK